MKLKKATIEDLISWGPCYGNAKIRRIVGGVTEFDALDVLKRDDIRARDRLWVVLRREMLDEKTMQLFSCYAARSVLDIYERDHPGDSRPRTAIDIAERYANGNATYAEMRGARNDAWYVARYTDWFLAWYAVNDGAWEAANSAAWNAANDASGVVAWATSEDEKNEDFIRWLVEHIEAVT